MSYKVTYAQNREDLILDAFFPEVKEGFYVDIGANDPIVDSVTKRFYDSGWRGINIEPQKKFFDLLNLERPEDTNLCIGVAEKEGELEFREYVGHGLSTFSKGMKKKYLSDKSDILKYHDYKVPVKTLRQVFKEHKVGHIHFMKVDVEGFEYEVLEGNDWKKYRPEIICIESNHIEKDWRPMLLQNGYKKAFFDGLNDYYLREESKDLENKFSYVNKILLGLPVISRQVDETFMLAKRTEALLLNEANILSTENDRLKTELEHARWELAGNMRIRALIKSMVRTVDTTLNSIIESKKFARRGIQKDIIVQQKAQYSDLTPDDLLLLAKRQDISDYPPHMGRVTVFYIVSRLIYRVLRVMGRYSFLTVKRLKGIRE